MPTILSTASNLKLVRYPLTEKPLTNPDYKKTYEDIFNLQKTVKLLLTLLEVDIAAVANIGTLSDAAGTVITLPAKAHRLGSVKIRGNSYYIPLYEIPGVTVELSASSELPSRFPVAASIVDVLYTMLPAQSSVQYTIEGDLPPGLVLTSTSATTATLSGTPTEEGTYNFSVVAKTQDGAVDWISYTCTVTAPAVAYLYWKFTQTSKVPGGASTYAQIGELAYNGITATGGIATADSIYGAGYEASKAFNGIADSGWCSTSTPYPHWIIYQFATPKTFDNVDITAATGADRQYAPDGFEISASHDGSTWVSIYNHTVPQTVWAASETRNFVF